MRQEKRIKTAEDINLPPDKMIFFFESTDWELKKGTTKSNLIKNVSKTDFVRFGEKKVRE